MTSKCNRYCSVPQCSNYKSKTVSLHYFPRDKIMSQKWAVAVRIDKPVSKRMSVCSDHFLPADFHPLRQYSTKRFLKTGVVPSQKIPMRKYDKPETSTSSARKSRVHKRSPSVPQKQVVEMETQDEEEFEEEYSARPVFIDETRYLELQRVDNALHVDQSVQVNLMSERDNNIRFHDYLLESNSKLSIYTGVNVELFNIIEQLVINTLRLFPTLNATHIQKKICIILTKLKLNLSYRALSVLYELSTTTIQKYFHEYIIVLYYALKPAIYFPTKEENLQNLPNCFKEYRKVRIVIDATEIPIQKTSCLDCRIRSYSHYKKTNTAKFLVTINPAGLIVHVSSAYGGRVSDKAIFNAEKIIDLLDPYQDEIMVDKGILIEKECAEKGIKLIRPPYLRKKQQFSKEEALKTASIARARVHVERSIQRIKIFKIFSYQLEWSLVPYLTEMMTIVCALVNLSNPIFSDDKFICDS